jgi:ubiquinone/menaquinone biosynthesis C-methylase UbiE
MYIQYGSGLSAPKEWINFDVSPTLRFQRIPVLGMLFRKTMKPEFPKNVKYGDITKGLPGIRAASCDGIYCSHVLEHLSLNDFQKAINNTYKLLKPGAIFRLVMPDFNNLVKSYIDQKNQNNPEACHIFMKNSGMASEYSRSSYKTRLFESFGNSRHQWLWDAAATIIELQKAGFKNIRPSKFNDSTDTMFSLVEDPDRFNGALALEAIK